MNVGSILNNDAPSDAGARTPGSSALELSGVRPAASGRPERQSIVNLLNDEDRGGKNRTPVRKNGGESTRVAVPGPNAGTKEHSSPPAERTDGGKADNSPAAVRAQRQHASADAPVDELGRLRQLKTRTKPTRYEVPPIWAQEWNPGRSGGSDGAVAGGGEAAGGSHLLQKRVFDPAGTASVDLECSITGVIPPASVTRTVAEWVYANFTEIPAEQRRFVELEGKFGLIVDKRTGRRIDASVASECIYTDKANTHFDMGVHEVGWRAMADYLDELEKKFQEEARKHTAAPGRPKHKFSRLELDVTDRFYDISERNAPTKKVRVSTDSLLKRLWAINKQRLSDLYIHNPLCMHDLRLSLLYELPFPDTSIESVAKNTPVLTRAKKRTLWTHRPTVTTFDLTRVQTPRELKNTKGKRIVDHDTSHEVELEIDVPELFAGYDAVRTGADTIRFEELVEIFLNNARCLNNHVTKMATK